MKIIRIAIHIDAARAVRPQESDPHDLRDAHELVAASDVPKPQAAGAIDKQLANLGDGEQGHTPRLELRTPTPPLDTGGARRQAGRDMDARAALPAAPERPQERHRGIRVAVK